MSYFLKCALWTFKVIRLLENCGIPIVFVAFRDKMQKSEVCFVNNRFPYNGGGGGGALSKLTFHWVCIFTLTYMQNLYRRFQFLSVRKVRASNHDPRP